MAAVLAPGLHNVAVMGRAFFGFVVLACAAWSCGGSSAIEENDSGGTGGTITGTGLGGSGNGDNCSSDVLSSLDEDCDGLGSAQMLLDLGAERSGTMTWAANMGAQLVHEPSTGTSNVTLRLSYAGGEARCNHTCDPCPNTTCGAAVEGPSIDIDVMLEIETADGALADSVPGVVTGWSADAAMFASEVQPSDLQGTMTLTAGGEFEDPFFGIYADFTSSSATGGVQGHAHHVDPNGPSLSGPVGNFTAP